MWGRLANLRPIGNRPRRIGFNAGLSKRHWGRALRRARATKRLLHKNK
jgi:hypothetical protein